MAVSRAGSKPRPARWPKLSGRKGGRWVVVTPTASAPSGLAARTMRRAFSAEWRPWLGPMAVVV